MRLQFQQLAESLKRPPRPVYLICGDEPLQLGEAAGLIREAASRDGYEEREVLEADGGFDWNRLGLAAQSLSLFARRRLIELRLSSAKVGREGSEAVRAYCAAPPEDLLLLIIAPAIESRELKTRWVQDVERIGVLLRVRPLEGRRLVEWVERRLRERGLLPGAGAAAMLAEHVEGNLLAADQEVEKLFLSFGAGRLEAKQLAEAISDCSRFSLFDFTDAALAGERGRTHRVLSGLLAEGTPPPLVLWALARELRLLARAAHRARQGRAGLEAFFAEERLWEARRSQLRSALGRLSPSALQSLLARCAGVDRQIKGLAPGDPWLTLAELADDLAVGGSPSGPRVR